MSDTKPRVLARICPCEKQHCLTVGDFTIDVPSQKVSVPLTTVLDRASQAQVFDAVAPTIDTVLDGVNATILTYGQTGSGKTYTLLGTTEQPGVVPRAFDRLGAALNQDPSMHVTVSMIELYCEKLKDLLDPQCEDLSIQRDSSHGCHVMGATERSAQSASDMWETVKEGLENRVVRSTGMNSESSRSHLLIYAFVSRAAPGSRSARLHSKLCLADLAGSERQSKTHAAGVSLTEGCAINKSLSALGNVLKALSEGAQGIHVPFRDSKLTRLLQDCLAGNALMALIVCMSPNMEHASETVSTLRFGSRALGISNVVKVNQEVSVEALQAECAALKTELAQLKAQLQSSSTSVAADAAGEPSDSGNNTMQHAAAYTWLTNLKASDLVHGLVLVQTVLLLALQW